MISVHIDWTNIKLIIGELFIVNDMEDTCLHPPTSRLGLMLS